jgi:hypothetical protein
MNTVIVDGVELVITPQGLDKVWAFRSELRVPLGHVRGATADTGVADGPRGLRAPGLAIPGKYVGTFKKDGESTYWNVSDRRRNVVIDVADADALGDFGLRAGIRRLRRGRPAERSSAVGACPMRGGAWRRLRPSVRG